MFGTILGGIGRSLLGGLGQKKQNKAIGKAYDQAGAAADPLFEQASGRLDPYAQTGQKANSFVSSLLGLSPGDTSGAEGLAGFRNSTGYRDTMDQAMGGVATNAAARGLLDSSGTGKTFQREASRLAQGSFGDFLNRLTGQQEMGVGAAETQGDIDQNRAALKYKSKLGAAGSRANNSGLFLRSLFGEKEDGGQ